MREISVRLPFLLPTRNQQDRMHFHEKRQLKDRIINEFLAAGVLPSARVSPMRLAQVIVCRHSTRAPDIDGLYGSVKQLLDVLQPIGPLRTIKGKLQHANPGGLGVILNDSPGHIRLHPTWVKSRLIEQHTAIVIRELDCIVQEEIK